jgi:ADP-heptose:LPS heptosyltransferase
VDVIVLRAGALGDVLLLRRTLAALRSASHRVRLVAPAAGEVLVGAGGADARLPWDSPEMAALLAGQPPCGPLGRALTGADATIAFTRSAPLADTLRPLSRRLVVHDPTPPPEGPHASVWMARALQALGIAAPVDPPDLAFSAEEREEADRRIASLPAGFLAIHPGSGSPAKNWPARRFLELARRRAGGQPFLLALGPAEIEAGFPAPPEALVAPGWPLRILAAAFSRAGLYVGNDSGASHLAAAAGAPTLALFGPTDPVLWRPVGRRVRVLRAPGGRLDALGVEDVLDAAPDEGLVRSAASGLPSG